VSQNSCLNCYRKHVATAMSFEDEARIGNAYPQHKWLAVGELNAAAKEVAWKYPLLAQLTRDYCLAYQNFDEPVPTIELLITADQIEESENKEAIILNNVEKKSEVQS
jgi:hypothetical protein